MPSRRAEASSAAASTTLIRPGRRRRLPPTLLIGDRAERDGLAARAAGAHVLLRASQPIAGWRTFARFDDALFAPMLA